MSAKQNTGVISPHEQTIIEKIDFLRQCSEDRRLSRASAKLSEKAFQEVWDNPEDAEYDKL